VGSAHSSLPRTTSHVHVLHAPSDSDTDASGHFPVVRIDRPDRVGDDFVLRKGRQSRIPVPDVGIVWLVLGTRSGRSYRLRACSLGAGRADVVQDLADRSWKLELEP
jgi:hypothetical protein